METQGALIWGLNEPWSVEEIEIGNPRHGEVTIQLEIAGTEVGEGVEHLAANTPTASSATPMPTARNTFFGTRAQ